LTTGEYLQRIFVIVATVGGAVIPILFLIQYTWLANWWRSSNGRLIVSLDVCICVARIPRVGELMHGNYRFDYNWVETLASFAIPAIILWRMWVFEQRRRRKHSARYVRAQSILAETRP
jgi:hypothetical protein